MYVTDPMCSWCWGFAPVVEALESETGLPARLVMGGLAADSDAPMPEETQRYVRSAWDAVERTTGARFNHDFWTRCKPRRSTYPACRAVLAAAGQGPTAGRAMFEAIQRAYYLDARNPSDLSTLDALAAGLVPPIDREQFADDLRSSLIDQRLHADLDEARSLGASSFPTLLLLSDELHVIASGWNSLPECRSRLQGLL
ncbi:MAG: putative protein-disulfide isomerase [Gammaproteobacteria bacterium]